MDSTGTNMCKAVEIEGVAVKATFESRVCVGGNQINVIKKIYFNKFVIGMIYQSQNNAMF